MDRKVVRWIWLARVLGGTVWTGGRSRGKKGSEVEVEDLFLEMRSFRHLRSSSPPPLVVHQFLRFATERKMSRVIAGYLLVVLFSFSV